MKKKLHFPLFLALNTYSFLLSAVTITISLFSFLLHRIHCNLLAIVVGCLALFFLFFTYQVWNNYNHRLRIYNTLLDRNRENFHLSSFEAFVDAPCHRLTVFLVLKKLGCEERYHEILKEYYVPPWRRGKRTSRIVLFKNQTEALEWLKKQRM